MTDDLKIAASDAVYNFMSALNDHISARVRYDRDGPRYAGDNPPDQDDVTSAFIDAVAAIIRSRI
jgi:hypothetical protein